MKHSLEEFSQQIISLIKSGGDSGDSGDKFKKGLQDSDNFVPTCCAEVSPLDSKWGQAGLPSGDKKDEEIQSCSRFVPTVPSVPTDFEQHCNRRLEDKCPSEWHAILAELNQLNCPDWLAPDRWAVMLSDAESFLGRWGDTAHQLGWTALDIFGVHPIAPAARFDIMGLLPLLHGGAVIALIEDAATIRRSSNAILTYRRGDQAEAVCITRITP